MNECNDKVTYQFAAFCKKVLMCAAVDCYVDYRRRRETKQLLAEQLKMNPDRKYELDAYSDLCYEFSVGKYRVRVQNELLGTALESLKESLLIKSQ